MLSPAITDISWLIIIASKHSTSDARNPLKVLLNVSASHFSAESIILAFSDVLSKIGKPSGENRSYRCQQMFSGTLPALAGEAVLEHWLKQAWLMVEEQLLRQRKA